MANKVKYGIKNVYFALETPAATEGGKPTYATPVHWVGARSISLDAEGEETNFAADNNTNYWQGSSNNGYSGSLTMANINTDFLKDILKETVDDKNVYTEYADKMAAKFALLFQFEGDESATRYVLYHCSATRPSIAGNTVDGSVEPEEVEINITAMAREFDNKVKAFIVKPAAGTEDTVYDGWFGTVYDPE